MEGMDGLIIRHYSAYNRRDLGKIIYHKNQRRGDSANLIICADTETSRTGKTADPAPCYVVAWSLSILNYNDDKMLAYYGHDPRTLIKFIEQLRADIGARICIYFHNLSYDYTFLRQAARAAWMDPEQLATRPHKPLQIRYKNGVRFQDSLILSQRSIEKWAADLKVDHQKAVGSWDYDKKRSQHEDFTPEELSYIQNDVLAQAECINATRIELGIKAVDDMPITSTAIVRNETRRRSRGSAPKRQNKWREKFVKMAPDLQTLMQLERGYHGGYVHANRYFIGDIMNGVEGADFTSAYPFAMFAYKFPMEAFRPFDGNISEILRLKDKFAFILDVMVVNFNLKAGCEMPYLQRSKLTHYSDDLIVDNGRVISGTLAQITYTEVDLELFLQLYDYEHIYIDNVKIAAKNYLPDWMRSYIADLFEQKCSLKHGDPVSYAISKTKINGLYGMCVEKYLKREWIEDPETGEYEAREIENKAEALAKKYKSHNTFLPYQWGVFVC